MNTLKFEPRDCARARELLDSYLDGELLVETNHEILKHLERCEACATELEVRTRLRDAVRVAGRREVAPPELRSLILDSVREPSEVPAAPTRAGRRHGAWWLAAAAALVVVAGGAVVTSRYLGGAGRTTAIDAVAADASILRIGLGDHAHCALQRPLPPTASSADAMRAALGPEYAGLVPIIAERMPADFELVEAHTCTFQSRRFVHMICRSDKTVLSIVVTRKSGEAFDPAGLFAVLQGSGIPVYRASMQGMEVDGLETRDHLAFVVSGLSAERSFQLASSLMPSMHAYLSSIEA